MSAWWGQHVLLLLSHISVMNGLFSAINLFSILAGHWVLARGSGFSVNFFVTGNCVEGWYKSTGVQELWPMCTCLSLCEEFMAVQGANRKADTINTEPQTFEASLSPEQAVSSTFSESLSFVTPHPADLSASWQEDTELCKLLSQKKFLRCQACMCESGHRPPNLLQTGEFFYKNILIAWETGKLHLWTLWQAANLYN